MGIEDGRADEKWNRTARDETGTERLDRNWASLLQELRVTQTGVQLLSSPVTTESVSSRPMGRAASRTVDPAVRRRTGRVQALRATVRTFVDGGFATIVAGHHI